ncbi:MAG: hypothetical protein ACYST6_17315 [Planctomycetota bacterium]
MLPGLQEVVGRDVATSHIGGGAGCGKSARPDLVRGWVRVTAQPTLQRYFSALLPPEARGWGLSFPNTHHTEKSLILIPKLTQHTDDTPADFLDGLFNVGLGR